MSILGDPNQSPENHALKLARDIVADELESIDRMHRRTMTYITAYMTVMALIFGALGWVGYERLQGIVLDATLKNVQEQTLKRVNDRVDDDLKRMDVPSLITNKIADFAAGDMRKSLIQEVEHGPVHDEIRRVALAASTSNRNLTTQSTNPPQASESLKDTGRTITDEQGEKFRAAAQKRAPPIWLTAAQVEDRNTGIGRNVTIFVLPNNTEAANYARQLKVLLKSIGWDADVEADSFVATASDRRLAVGLHLIINPDVHTYNAWQRRSNEAVTGVFACLSQAVPSSPASLPTTMKKFDTGSFIAVGAQN